MLPNQPITYNSNGIKTTRPNTHHSGFITFSDKDLCDIFAMPKSIVTNNINLGNSITSINIQLIGRYVIINKQFQSLPVSYCTYCSYNVSNVY